MKDLIFLRHAKSDWATDFLKDIDRPLSERGYRDAYFLSDWFAGKHPAPDLIISSTATRALNTALIFARAMEFDMSGFMVEESVYESSVSNLVNIIKGQDNEFNSIMFVGHNPTFTEICNDLSQEQYFENVPTCGMISMKFNISSWQQIRSKTGKINFFEFPKNFKNHE